MYKSYKFRLYPNEITKHKLELFFTAVNFVYNYYLDKRKKELNLSFYDTKKDLNMNPY